VLVTRPRRQGVALAERIEARGGVAIRFPVIEIASPRHPEEARATMKNLDRFDWVVFISPNAVEHGLAMAPSRDSVPASTRVAAVGEATARALDEAGLGPVLTPRAGASSEALLALPEFNGASIDACHVLVVKGEGGREVLGDTLSKRGARVAYAETYRRARPAVDASGITDQGVRGDIDVIVITSGESLDNLFALVGAPGSSWLRGAVFVVASARIAELVRAKGVSVPPVVADGANDEALMDAIVEWANRGD
jgi:uroporphyrinogen-III synthase